MRSYKRKKTYKKKTYKKRDLKKKTYKKKTLIKKTFKRGGGGPKSTLLNALNALNLEAVKSSFIEEGNALMDYVTEGSDKKPLINYFLENIHESLTEDNIRKWEDIAIFLYLNGYHEDINKNDIIKYALERQDFESILLIVNNDNRSSVSEQNKVMFLNMEDSLNKRDIYLWNIIKKKL